MNVQEIANIELNIIPINVTRCRRRGTIEMTHVRLCVIPSVRPYVRPSAHSCEGICGMNYEYKPYMLDDLTLVWCISQVEIF